MFKKFSIMRQSAAKSRFKRSGKVQRIGIETIIISNSLSNCLAIVSADLLNRVLSIRVMITYN